MGERLYLAGWSLACVLGVIVAIRARRDLVLFSREYFRWLLRPWKLVLFVLALAVFVVGAPYSGDPTWDWEDATFMSILTFATAPWSVGTLTRAARGRAPWSHAWVALVAWLFSASWSYDLYILLRDGFYPHAWWSNAIASSVLYVAAGLLFSLEARPPPRGGVTFGFLEPEWPALRARGEGKKLALLAFVLVALVAAMMLPFFVEEWRRTHAGRRPASP